MRQPPVAQHVVEGSGRARLLVPRAEDDARHPGREDRAGAHDARLERDDERRAHEVPVAGHRRRFAERLHLGVRGGILTGLAEVPPAPDDDPVRVHHDRAHGHVTGGRAGPRLVERDGHPALVVAGDGQVQSRSPLLVEWSLCEST